MNDLRIYCRCGGEHYFRIGRFEDEEYIVMVDADNNAGFFGRVWEALKYITGKELIVHEVIVSDKDWEKVRDYFACATKRLK